jgi:hypothetical protein
VFLFSGGAGLDEDNDQVKVVAYAGSGSEQLTPEQACSMRDPAPGTTVGELGAGDVSETSMSAPITFAKTGSFLLCYLLSPGVGDAGAGVGDSTFPWAPFGSGGSKGSASEPYRVLPIAPTLFTPAGVCVPG